METWKKVTIAFAVFFATIAAVFIARSEQKDWKDQRMEVDPRTGKTREYKRRYAGDEE